MTTASRRTDTLSDRLLAPYILPAWTAEIVLPLAFSLFVGLCAQISLPLPFTPVPLTGQTFGVLLTGAALGARRGALALTLYLLEGAMGLPVFAGGALGVAKLWGPTGGYLLAFPFAAALTGWLAGRGWDRRPAGAFAAMLLGSAVIFAFGMAWLARFVGGVVPAFVRGVLPFLPGDCIKTLLAAALLPSAWAIVRRVSGQEKS